MNSRKTIRYTMEDVAPAVAMLQKGGLVALPTETVYGLAVNAENSAAVWVLYEVKQREREKALSVLVTGMEMVENYCQNIPPQAYALAEHYWPGPLTMILEDKGVVSALVNDGSGTLGVRCPDHPLTQAILRQAGVALAAPSANPSDQPSPKTAQEVLDYFDAFLIGLTATPDKRTFAFFNENVVSEYSREQAIIDGVNVGEDIFLIETQVTKSGAHIMKQVIECRNRLSREKRWKQLDEDVDYKPTQLDRDIVNPSQIRMVIRTFRDNLFTTLFPRRKEVPKTLIFAKTDSHADDIIQIVREEFGEGNEFCRKITYSAENPESVLSEFRNDYNPRIAVTVDMIATGTDVKPIECLIFMRDVRSKNYFEQMKGRGTRTLSKDDLQKVTPSATENKDHFVIVDAVGVTKSKKSETRTLERKPSVSLKELMMTVALGARDEDTLTSLANRVIRLNSQMSSGERKDFAQVVGVPASQLAEELLNAFDEDILTARAQEKFQIQKPTEEQLQTVQREAATQAAAPFCRPEVRDFIENVRRSHEQIIDNTNPDTLLFAGFDTQKEENADRAIRTFHEFIEENKDEIIALRILYSQAYQDRPMAIEKLKALYERLRSRGVPIERLWDCYANKKPEKVKGTGTLRQLADLVSIIRFEMGEAEGLQPFADKVNYNFQQWTFRRNAGAVHFTPEQMEWLQLVKDHIATSLSIQPEDLDLSPFDRKGGLGRFYEVFGEEFEAILVEMNRELVA